MEKEKFGIMKNELILEKLITELISDSQDLDPEIIQMVNDNFWGLLIL